MKSFYLAALAALATGAPAQSPRDRTPSAIPQPPALSDELKRSTFDLVWMTMRDRYYDRSFKGLDWTGIGEDYRPRALAATTHPTFHAILNEMVKTLGDSHLSVIGPPSPDAPFGSVFSSVGITLVAGGERMLVAAVEDGSAAAKAGIKPGDEILEVGGKNPEAIGAQYVASLSAHQRPLGLAQRWLAVQQQLRGPAGTDVIVKIASKDATRAVRLTRSQSSVHGKIEPPSFQMIDQSTGLLSLTAFHTNIDALLSETFSACASCTRLIIDVRGNNGGLADNIVKLLDRLMPGPGIAGISTTAKGPEPLRFTGSPQAFRGSVAVLIDGRSSSAAEVFAAAIQDLARGKVFGSRSGGAVILSDIQPLPTGGSQLVPFAAFRRSTSRPLEGVGVVPDVPVTPGPDELRSGRDAVLEAARQ